MSIRFDPSSWTFRFARAFGVVVLVAVVAAAAQAKPPTNRGGDRCNPRKASCAPTTTDKPPTVTITSPQTGSVVAAGIVTVTGTATDDRSVTRVEAGLAGGPLVLASGTSSWSAEVDLATADAGDQLLEVRATDSAGNVGRSTLSLTIAGSSTAPDPSPSPDPSEEPLPVPDTGSMLMQQVIVNPDLTQDAVPAGRGRMAADGDRMLLLYQSEFSQEPWAYIRDTQTGAAGHVRLPHDGSSWRHASYVLHGRDLWVMSGSSPVVFRHLRFDTVGIPSSAVSVSSRTFGDEDSRPGELIRLASGALVAVWHQQGRLGPQGHRIAYLPPGGSAWSVRNVAHMPTMASRDVVAQHPADGSVWVFSNADAWGAIGAIRLVESNGTLSVDRTEPLFIDDRFGEFDADPETPALAVTVDFSRGEIVLAYQTTTRRRFSNTVLGSYPAVVRIDAAGQKSFHHLPVWVERASDLGIGLRGDDTWLAYRPVDEQTLRFDVAHVGRLVAGRWTTSELGRFAQTYDPIHFAPAGVGFAIRRDDGRIHLYR